MELLINRVEKKTTKNGKAYWLVNGKYYVWSDLNLAEGTKYNVTVEQNGQYPKITDAVQIAAPAGGATVPPPVHTSTTTTYNATSGKDEMIVSYAKDIAIEAFSFTSSHNPFNRAIDIAIATRLAYIILTDRHKSTEEFAKDVKILRTIAEEFGIQDIEAMDVSEPVEDGDLRQEVSNDNSK